MGLYDFLTFANDKKDWTELLAGKYSIALGDNLSAFLGAGRQTHIVGDNITYVFDYESLLGKIPVLGEFIESLPAELALGAGGNITAIFGRKVDLHYIGPSIGIKRAGSVNATSQSNFFAEKTPFGPVTPEFTAKQTIDTSTGVICGLLSAAMVLVNTGVEIAARVKYQDKASDKDEEAIEQMAKYCTADMWLTTRLLAVIKAVETCAAVARTETSEFFDAQNKLKTATFGLAVCGLEVATQEAIAARLKKAADDVKDFLTRNAEVLLAVAVVMTFLAIAGGLVAAAALLPSNNN